MASYAHLAKWLQDGAIQLMQIEFFEIFYLTNLKGGDIFNMSGHRDTVTVSGFVVLVTANKFTNLLYYN